MTSVMHVFLSAAFTPYYSVYMVNLQ